MGSSDCSLDSKNRSCLLACFYETKDGERVPGQRSSSSQIGESTTLPNAEKKNFTHLKRTIPGLQKKPVDERSPMEELLDVQELTHQKDCDKLTCKMVDRMLQQALIPQGKNGRPPSNFILCTKSFLKSLSMGCVSAVANCIASFRC
jgi:hypothetical protein